MCTIFLFFNIGIAYCEYVHFNFFFNVGIAYCEWQGLGFFNIGIPYCEYVQ